MGSSSCCCLPLESWSLSQVLPDEHVVDILSYLPVNSLLRFKSVSKSWNSLISHPNFVNLHLQRSLPNHTHVLIIYSLARGGSDNVAVPCSIRSWLDNAASAIFQHYSYSKRLSDYDHVVDSCNGLVCLCRESYHRLQVENVREYHLLFWNPAIKSVSKTLPPPLPIHADEFLKLGFGYDDSTHTYKVAAFIEHMGYEHRITIKLYTLGDHDPVPENCWRHILTLPSSPDDFCLLNTPSDAKTLNGTLNLLVSYKFGPVWSTDQLVIVSFDLRTETYRKLSLPREFVRMPIEQIEIWGITVLRGSLWFFHNFIETEEFVLWQMNEFGVEKSWIQLVRIRIDGASLLPLFTFENPDVVMLSNKLEDEALLYYPRDNTIEWHAQTLRCVDAMDYVQSLVLPY